MAASGNIVVNLCLLFLINLMLSWVVTSDTGDFSHKPCIRKDFGDSSYVCVCNATYCDNIEPNDQLDAHKFAAYVSSKDGHRLDKDIQQFMQNAEPPDVPVYTIDRTKKYQSILGFGGAFTDAAGINIASLSKQSGENLLRSYFSPQGLEYTIGRIPIASCDFSTHVYSYDDTPGDFELTHFALSPEDFHYKIPYIHRAQQMNRRPITLFSSPWSSPGWMKNSGKMPGNGTLVGKPGDKYYKTWGNYFLRFLQEYRKQNISIWGVTAQNEPTTGFSPNYSFQTLGFTPQTQRDFVEENLGPTLEQNGFRDVKIMVLDDQRYNLPFWPEIIMKSKTASKYVSGIAVHWYADYLLPPELLTWTHQALPDKFILYTEACEGYQHWNKSEKFVILGSWERFESYVKNIMDDLSNWVVGWTDWNLALNMQGGPNWVKNFVDSPIIVNKDKDEFYKQPMFYGLGHFSKFLPKNSVRIDLTQTSGSPCSLQVLAFSTPEGSIVLQIFNSKDISQKTSFKDPNRGFANVQVPARSMMTVVWW